MNETFLAATAQRIRSRRYLCGSEAGNHDCDTEHDRSYGAQDFELPVSKTREPKCEVYISPHVTPNISNPNNTSNPCVCCILLISYAWVHDQSTQASLYWPDSNVKRDDENDDRRVVYVVAVSDMLISLCEPNWFITALIISGTQACQSNETPIAILPPTIKGRRLPYFDRHSSLSKQKYGWRSAPRIGSDNHISDNKYLLIPKLIKYSYRWFRIHHCPLDPIDNSPNHFQIE